MRVSVAINSAPNERRLGTTRRRVAKLTCLTAVQRRTTTFRAREMFCRSYRLYNTCESAEWNEQGGEGEGAPSAYTRDFAVLSSSGLALELRTHGGPHRALSKQHLALCEYAGKVMCSAQMISRAQPVPLPCPCSTWVDHRFGDAVLESGYDRVRRPASHQEPVYL